MRCAPCAFRDCTSYLSYALHLLLQLHVTLVCRAPLHACVLCYLACVWLVHVHACMYV